MKDSSIALAIKVAELHANYHKEFLSAKKRKKPNNNKSAITFIFGMSFYQGRKDTLSDKFFKIARNFIETNNISKIKPVTNSKNTKDKKLELIEQYNGWLIQLYNLGLKKEADRIMVIDTIGLANHLLYKYNLNIVDYIVNEIRKGNLVSIYELLLNIYSIGPKISSLILRDIIHIYKLEKYITKLEEFAALQPIDTWVHQVSFKIGIIQNEEIYKREAIEISKFCIDNNINPLHYNEGAWYLGSQSFKYALSSLLKIKV